VRLESETPEPGFWLRAGTSWRWAISTAPEWMRSLPSWVHPRLVPLGRIGSPEEAGKLACFLLSDDAAFRTGHALVADGGECLPG
jgi:NAD(P)-dependent dehydrogenase (short-subunit alcohol dehydrogenase family)